MDSFFAKTHCDRCGGARPVSMSRLTTQGLCEPCLEDERLAPGFRAGREAEHQAVLRGDYNFPGVGLSPEDEAFLAQRRAERALSRQD